MAGATLVIRILADARQAAQVFNKASGQTSKFAGALNKAALPAAAVVGGLGLAAKAAAQDQQAQALLANTMRKSAGATDAQIASTEEWIAKQSFATGVADDQLRPALSALVRSTGDVATAQQGLGVALDVSAATGKDVESVSTAMAKAYAGNTTSLGKMVPGIDKGVLATKDMNKITAELSRTMGGSAAVKADTAAGQYQRFTVAVDETKEAIGAALLPVLAQLGGVLRAGATWAAQNAGALHTIVIVLGALAVAVLVARAGILAYNIVTGIMAGLTATSAAAVQGNNVAMVAYAIRLGIVKAAQLAARTATLLWTGAQWLLNVALTANPIGLIIAAIIALVAVIIIAYKKSQTFRNIVQGAWHGIQAAAQFVWNNVLKPIFQFIINYYRALWMIAQQAGRLIVGAWNGIKAGVATAWNWIKTNVIDKLIAAFKACWQKAEEARTKIRDAWNAIKTAISNAWDTIRGIFDKLIGKVRDVIDWIKKIKLPGALTSLAGKLGIPGFKSAAPAVAVPVQHTALAGTRGSATLVQPGRADRTPVVVNVFLDGKRVGGYVDRVITSRLDAEGARLLAGAWG